MKKVFTIAVAVICTVFFADIYAQPVKSSGMNRFLSSQKKNKSTGDLFAQRFCTYQIDGKQYLSVIIKLKEGINTDFLKKYDCIIGSQSGRIVTLRVNTEDIEALVEDNNISVIETSRRVMGKEMNNAMYDLQAYNVQQGKDLLQSYTGRDVLIGIADWGIDYTHPNFYDTLENEYRIVAAWDQYRNQGPAPEGFSYGTLIEGKDALLLAGCDTSNIYDTGYHATHVAGITGGGGAGGDYRGVAIDANWLFCTWLVDEASVMDGYAWMRNVAKQQNKRLVINNSWGVYSFGTMDGTGLLDEYINNMSEEDSVIFVVSAGNNGDVKFHVGLNFDNTETDTLKSEIKFNFPTPYGKNYWGQTITLQGENTNAYISKIEFYDRLWNKLGETAELDNNGAMVEETVFLTPEGDSIIYRASSRDAFDSPIVDWEIRISDYTVDKYHIVLAVTSLQGTVHGWNVACLTTAVGNWGLDFVAADNTMVEGDSEYGVSVPGLAEKAITVAAHKYRKNQSWAPLIASFSSLGPNLTQYYKPEISAPGYYIVSSLSSFATTDYQSYYTAERDGKEYKFVAVSGTSMAAPMVTGSVALMLEADRNITADKVKSILIQTAKTDDYTMECPNDTWGYGKLNTWEAVKRTEATVGLNEISDEKINIYPVPAVSTLNINGVANNSLVSVYDCLGKVVYQTQISDNKIDIQPLKSGLYILSIKTGDSIKKVKFVKN